MANFRDKIRTRIQKFLKTPDIKKSTEHIPDTAGDMNKFTKRLTKSYYDSLTESVKRIAKYAEYRYLDRNLAEATATLNIYADNIVSGAIGGEENYKLVVDRKTPNLEKIEKVVKETEKRTGIKDDVWDIARDLICFGDDFEEIVIAEQNGEVFVQKLKRLPIEQVYADVDERGVWKDPKYPYAQKKSLLDKNEIKFEEWRMIHFRMGRGIYGVERSIFSNASRRIGRQLLWIDDSAVLARLSRAYQRFAFFIDTSGLGLDDKFRFTEEWMERVRRKDIIDRTTGRISPLDAPWMPDEDIGIPTDKDNPQDVKVLSGDLNLGRIDDILYVQEKFFMALNMPKQYASKEEGVRAKATITQLDIQFARQVRRKQAALKPGLRKFYRTAFYLDDIDPDSFEWEVVFPAMATMDEYLKWEMERVKAGIAKTYAVDAGALNNLWILEKLLGFSKEEVARYSAVTPEEIGKEGVNVPPEIAAAIRKDPQLRWALEDLKDLSLWKLSREKDLEGKKEIGSEREESLNDKWKE